MLVALHCHDKPGHLNIRKANRDAHVAHLKDSGIVVMAGPLLDDAGEMCGSLVIFDVQSPAQVHEWAAEDPYALAGLFENVDIKPWNKVIG